MSLHLFENLLTFVPEDGMAILRGFGIDNVVNSGLEIFRWIRVNVEVGLLEILVAIVSSGTQRV